MYKVISIKNYEMTRDLRVVNLNTGTVDFCFDDSALVCDKNFSFMKEGNEYDCKIKLFGTVVSDMQDNTVMCKIVNPRVNIGKQIMIQVMVKKDEYYIPERKIGSSSNPQSFYFKYSRKDLIEVDNVVHADLLWYAVLNCPSSKHYV